MVVYSMHTPEKRIIVGTRGMHERLSHGPPIVLLAARNPASIMASATPGYL